MGREINCEVAVIGSGPGGALTACLLAEAGRDVILLEEGPAFDRAACPRFSPEELRHAFRNGGLTPAFGRPTVAYAEARCVGGGAEINAALYHRTPPEILEAWARDYCLVETGYSDLLPHFEACESDLGVTDAGAAASKASLKLRDGAVALGWKGVEAARASRTVRDAYLPRAVRAGCRLMPEARVLRLTQAGERWKIRALARNGHGKPARREITARTVFVAGGAVQTPALLRRSGILAHVGQALQMHPTVKITALFPEEVNSPEMGVPRYQVKEFSPRMSFGCSVSNPTFLGVEMCSYPMDAKRVGREWRNMAIYYAMVSGGASRGKIRNLPPFRDPFVRYQLTSDDLADLLTGLKRLSGLLFEAGATALFPSARRTQALRDRREAEAVLGSIVPAALNAVAVHLFSSCPMGENRRLCATDSFGRVHGRKNLFVSDASLLCGSPGVNPQGTIMAIARRNALRFIGAQ